MTVDKTQLEQASPVAPVEAEDDDSGLSVKQYLLIAVGGALGLILVVFIVGFLIVLFTNDPLATSDRIAAIRDILLIIMVFLGVMIVVSLAVLVLQVARLADTIQGEVQPMVENTREATETVKGTAQFIGRNATGPFITIMSIFSGIAKFLSELGGVRRAVRRRKKE
jgi:hypothetical protein